MSFYVGQKVVCVDASRSPNPRQLYPFWLVLHRVYEIEGFGFDFGNGPGILVCGDPCMLFHSRTGEPLGWKRSRFRPVIEHQTDITVFQQILHRVSNKTPETVR